MRKLLLKLSSNTEKISTKRYILVFAGILLFMGYLSINNITGSARLKEVSNGVGTLDMKFSYSSREAYDTIKAMGALGRQFYVKWLIIDYVFSLSLMIFSSILITYFLKKLSILGKMQKINLLPYIRGTFDYLENCFILIMLFNYPKELIVVASIANVMTIMKWTLYVIYLAILIILIIMTAWKAWRRSPILCGRKPSNNNNR